ncbi:hypothetical protein LCGC14_0371090 [marine sediment metagenome]|uniref:Uncharacterized protein n=1 Tax=marine sediment metagenome TaxID=412755 RepID=A0A0F9WDW5_9ZZZZ|nr:hypothetical protein [Maribacter sp.]HDZ04865.1 hypothetical protein [Maribacter sp.]
MKFLEKDLEDIIWDNIKDKESIENLINKGFPIYYPNKIFRQFKIGAYGIADVITFERPRWNIKKEHAIPATITVYELKKDLVSTNTFLQALRYIKGIRNYLEKREFKYPVTYKIICIGSDVNMDDDIIYLVDFLLNSNTLIFEIYTYDYSINGIGFNKEGEYKLKYEGF